MICSYLQKKEITNNDNRIAAHLVHFLNSRLPKPGDEPKVQDARLDLVTSRSQLTENKTEVKVITYLTHKAFAGIIEL